MFCKVLLCVTIVQVIVLRSFGKNVSIEVKVDVDLPTNISQKTVENRNQDSDDSNEVRQATDEVPPVSTQEMSADAKQNSNATDQDLPSAFANVDPEFTKKIVELKKQAMKIMQLRGKKVNPDVKIEENAGWDDILIDQSLYENIKAGFDEEEKRLTLKDESDRMTAPNFNAIPYSKWSMPIKYTTTLMKDKAKVALIEKALKEIQTKSGCIKFQKVQSATGPHIEYKEVKDLGNMCAFSPLCMQPEKNTINVNHDCLTYGTYVHETLHSLGFHHTQARPDVEQYVKINWDNIVESAKFNFKVWPYALANQGPYDFGSIMQYYPYAFAIDKTKPTIVPKVSVPSGVVMGQRSEMSKEDVRLLKKIYCEGTQPDKNADCIDKTTSCPEFAEKGYCVKGSLYYGYTIENCRFSCKLCK